MPTRHGYAAPMQATPKTPAPRPTEVRRLRETRQLRVLWSDGHESLFDWDYLRGWCPCAGCQGHGGELHFVEAENTDLAKITIVGNYALGLVWGDGHETGIYSYAHLRDLDSRDRE